MKNCPYCGNNNVNEINDYKWKGYKVNSTVYKCENCKEIHLPSDAISKIELINRRISGLLLPEEIKKYREKINQTQADIAKSLGVGLKTYLRWENGYVYQTKEHDDDLRNYFEQELNRIERKESASEWIDTLAQGTHPRFNYLLATHSNSQLSKKQQKVIVKILSDHE